MTQKQKITITRDELRTIRWRCYAKLADDASDHERHVIRHEYQGRVRDAIMKCNIISGFDAKTTSVIAAAVERCRTFLDNAGKAADERDRSTAFQLMHDAICDAIVADLDAEAPPVKDSLPKVVPSHRMSPGPFLKRNDHEDAGEDPVDDNDQIADDDETDEVADDDHDDADEVVDDGNDLKEPEPVLDRMPRAEVISTRTVSDSESASHRTTEAVSEQDAKKLESEREKAKRESKKRSAYDAYDRRISQAWKNPASLGDEA